MIPNNPYLLNPNLHSGNIDESVNEFVMKSSAGEATGDLKCWLTYRCIEGKLEYDKWLKLVRTGNHNEKDEHMNARWMTSQATAETYLFAKRNDWSSAIASANSCILGWMQKNHIWIPQSLNMLRCSCIMSYYSFLTGNQAQAVEIADLGIQLWKESVSALVWREWTLRFTEMRDDIVALQILAFIAGRCGVPVIEMKWMNTSICMPKERWNFFYDILIDMGNLNKKTKIWKRNKSA